MNKKMLCAVSIVMTLLLEGCSSTNLPIESENSVVSDSVNDFADKEALSKQLTEKWLDKWNEISLEKDGMVSAKASIFCVPLRDGSIISAIIYPCYKNNCAVFYRLSDNGISEYGEFTCGWNFEILDNGEDEFLHINTVYPASAVGTMGENGEIDDEYFRITESRLESVLCVGRQVFDGESVSWFQYDYDNEYHASEITSAEYENLKTEYLQDSSVIFSENLDENGDYQNDVFYSFEDNSDEFQSAIQSLLNAEAI